MTNLIQCNSCNKHNSSNQIRIDDEAIKPGLQKRVWYCTHCKHEHLIMIMNKTTRRLMKENRKDRERISGINRRSQQLKKQGKFTSGQAKYALKQQEEIEQRINERTGRLDKLSKELMDDYIASLRVDL